MQFELVVAVRYLKAKRKQAVISLITLISVVGVAAGVAALIIALAINAGFSEDLRKKLLGAQAHVSILARGHEGIADYLRITKEIEQTPGVVLAAPGIFQKVLISTDSQNEGVVLKGIIPEMEHRLSALSDNMVQGSVEDFKDNSMIIGQELAKTIGSFKGDRVRVVSDATRLTPLGAVPRFRPFEVTGIFSSGLYDYDSSWVYVPINAAQRLLGVGDVANTIEVKVDDIYQARAIGRRIVERLGGGFEFTDWIEMNQSIFQALRLERLVMFITIGLIVLVAALNIVATLIMMVLEKTRDIAILMSMGATNQNIRRIFILQGVVIGVVGTAFGVVIGQVISRLADKFHLISLAPDIYTIAYVPFRAQPLDSAIVAAAAILISFLATLYPSAAASQLHPVEALRYE
ncbi:MAG: lipoprotein-releasing ABC transporter permease subunit [Acidobacteria bacterium]|nr:lipoprotein-releasing ABC transporter permease subunit [Acidobacteriota bacterium]